jgi:V/A-type H+-transporting ATPase subunit D
VPLSNKVPPGRAGRIWLQRRLSAAERGREQLDRKLRVLVAEQVRLGAAAARCQGAWADACEEAARWFLRASLLGGRDAIRQAMPPEPVTTTTTWAQSVGVRYPGDITVDAGADGVARGLGNAAVAPSIRAFDHALQAGVRAAAADEAVRRVSAEIAVTRRRMRALDKRWLPWLYEARAQRELSLEQAEQEDGVRLRRATGRDDDAATRVL